MTFKDPHQPVHEIPKKLRGAFNRWKKIKLTPVSDRFWKKVSKAGPDDCWPYNGPVNKAGYGVFSPWANKVGRCLAHRKAWEITNGPIPKGLFICHRCDNPPCCNPNHLFSGTQSDNMKDCQRKGRVRGARGENHFCCKLTEPQVVEIRKIGCSGTISRRRIGILFGVSKATVQAIISRRKWKHVI